MHSSTAGFCPRPSTRFSPTRRPKMHKGRRPKRTPAQRRRSWWSRKLNRTQHVQIELHVAENLLCQDGRIFERGFAPEETFREAHVEAFAHCTTAIIFNRPAAQLRVTRGDVE